MITAFVLYGLGMFFWGYRMALSMAAKDMREIEKKTQVAKGCSCIKDRE